MDGFEKIDLDSKKEKGKEVPSDMARKRKPIRLSKPVLTVLGVLVVLFVLSIFTVVLPAKDTYTAGLKAYRQSKLATAAIKQQNINLASEELAKTKVELAATQKQFSRMSFLRFIPIANWYYNDGDHLMKAASYGMNAGETVLNSLKPYADVLGLKGGGSFVGGSAEERIKTAVLTMGKITPEIDNIAGSLEQVQKEIDQVNPNHYPSFLFGSKIKTQLTQVQTLTDQGVVFVTQARPLIKTLPLLLGEKEAKRYLVIFQNDKELRPTGGFITAYSIFNVDKGVLKVERSDDIYKLDDAIANKPKAPEAILKYLPKVYTFNLRDSNLSPDYIVSMQQFLELYNKSSQKVDVDGIIAIDTNVLVNTIRILDDQVSAGGLTFTTKIDKRCDCPQVIYELEDNISRPVGYVKEDRKGLIGSLLYAIMQKSLSSSPKIYWGPLFQDFIMEANQKHVLFYFFDKDAQSGIESLNMAGRIKPAEGDYLHINDTNFAGGKANLFVKEAVDNKYEVKSDGTVVKTLTITYTNDYPPSDCNLERGGLCLNAPLRNWLRIYVPKGSKLIESKGSEVKISTKEDLGKTYFEGFTSVAPRNRTIFTISYELPFKVKKGSPLPVLIQKQPGTFGNMYTNFVNGRQVGKQFQLFADFDTKLKI